jgi:hypothetical protein
MKVADVGKAMHQHTNAGVVSPGFSSGGKSWGISSGQSCRGRGEQQPAGKVREPLIG